MAGQVQDLKSAVAKIDDILAKSARNTKAAAEAAAAEAAEKAAAA